MTGKADHTRLRAWADISCPSCGATVAGIWTDGKKTAPQICGGCGASFEGKWPGFNFRSEVWGRPADDAEGGAP